MKNPTPDPRIEQLREQGLSRVWLDVAEALGADEFFRVWKDLCAESANSAA